MKALHFFIIELSLYLKREKTLLIKKIELNMLRIVKLTKKRMYFSATCNAG